MKHDGNKQGIIFYASIYINYFQNENNIDKTQSEY